MNITATPAGIALRLYLCLRTLVVVVVSLNAPLSINAQMVAQAGALGYALVYVLSGLACLGILDLLINDCLPERYRLPFAEKHRHLGYILLSLGGFSFLFVMAKNETLSWLSLSYLVDASMAVFVAVLHVVRRIPSRNYPALERRHPLSTGQGPPPPPDRRRTLPTLPGAGPAEPSGPGAPEAHA